MAGLFSQRRVLKNRVKVIFYRRNCQRRMQSEGYLLKFFIHKITINEIMVKDFKLDITMERLRYTGC